ncbi:hypothetical protein HDU76_005659 [Blyttiomyces sp. JEL0837]|nr:hypothetical protein HDU76_005659 [Blyttiomyces sp. JEL0837]
MVSRSSSSTSRAASSSISSATSRSKLLRKQGFSSLWDALPSEIVNQIIHSSDILTRCLHNNLTQDQIEDKATEIWLEAFRQDWSGDLSLLPTSGFPTTRTGLCIAHSKTMLQRLRTLRPDLDINTPGELQDTFRVLIKDNTHYGFIINGSEAPVVDLDECDPIKPGGSSIYKYIHQLVAINMMSSAIINISMRHCFIDDLQPYISHYPISIAAMTIELDHFNLLRYLVEEIKSVDLSTFPVLESGPERRLEPYYAAAKNNNFQMFRYLHEKKCPYRSQQTDQLLRCLVKHDQLGFIEFAFNVGLFTENEFKRLVPKDSRPAPQVTNLDIWKWVLDNIYSDSYSSCKVIPVASDIKSARCIIATLGEINKAILSTNARMLSSIAAFEELWNHRDESVVIECGFPSHIAQNNIEEVKIWLMDLHNWRHHYQCSVDAFIHAHSYTNTNTNNTTNICIPNCSRDIISHSIVWGPNINLLKAINNVCRCPNAIFTSRHVDEAAHTGDFNMVKYLLQNRPEGCTGQTFNLCADNGYLDIVKYLWEHQRRKCDADDGLDHAMLAGHLNIVKFMIECGGMVFRGTFKRCVKKGYFHVVKYLWETGSVECTASEMLECAEESQSLNMVRYVRELFPELS